MCNDGFTGKLCSISPGPNALYIGSPVATSADFPGSKRDPQTAVPPHLLVSAMIMNNSSHNLNLFFKWTQPDGSTAYHPFSSIVGRQKSFECCVGDVLVACVAKMADRQYIQSSTPVDIFATWVFQPDRGGGGTIIFRNGDEGDFSTCTGAVAQIMAGAKKSAITSIVPIPVQFTNKSAQAMNLFHDDGNGPQLNEEIPPGAKLTKLSFDTHIWHAVAASGKHCGTFALNREYGESAKIFFRDAPEAFLNSKCTVTSQRDMLYLVPPGLKSVHTKVRKFCEIEFYNEFPVTLKVYFVDYFGFRRLLGAVAPRTVFHFVGYGSQVFVVEDEAGEDVARYLSIFGWSQVYLRPDSAISANTVEGIATLGSLVKEETPKPQISSSFSEACVRAIPLTFEPIGKVIAPVNVRFVNNTKKELRIMCVLKDGSRSKRAMLPPGGHAEVLADLSVWVAEDKSGQDVAVNVLNGTSSCPNPTISYYQTGP